MKREFGSLHSHSERASSTGENRPSLAQRELVSRIVVSPVFARSERLCTLLTYVCDMTLKGREAEINEQKIGHAVFGRPQDYDSSVDGIVRTQASRLRQRLDLYFQQEGADEPLRIVIPRGGYVPVFEPRSSNLLPTEAEPLPTVPNIPSPPNQLVAPSNNERRLWLPWVLCAVLVFVVIVLWTRDHRAVARSSATASSPHPLWSHIFIKGQPTLAIPADSGLVLFQNTSGRSLSLSEYLQGDYRSPSLISNGNKPGGSVNDWLANLASRRYTSVVDLNAIISLEHRAEASQSELQVRFARDVRPNDLKQGSAILIGASEANPWVELFERNMNFVFRNNYEKGVFSVLNRSPQSGEPKQWDSLPNDPQRRVFGLVAYVPNLAGDGSALILEGTSMSGTEGAWDFVSDDSQLLPFLKRIQRPDGTVPHFELLLGTQNVNASAVQSRLLAWRVTN